MKKLSYLVLLFAVLFTYSCSDNDDDSPEDTGITINDLVGSWNATSMKFTNNSNAAEQFDFIAAGGELRFTMLTGGGVRTWVDIADFSDEWDSQATLTDNSTLVLTPVEASRETITFKFTLSGNTLTLTNSEDSFDFTLSGENEVSATSVTVLQKQ